MQASLLIRLLDQFSGPAQKVRQGLKGLGEAANEAKKAFSNSIKQGFSVENLEAATHRAEQQLSKSRQRLLGAVAMGASILAPAKMAADFSAQMANVSTLIDTSVESMSNMKEQILAVADRTPVALADLTGALYDVRSAGIKAGDSMAVLEGSARLGIAGLGDTKQAVDLVTSSINAFNLKGKDQTHIYDVIFKAVKNGKTTISGLAQGFGAVAGTVANANIKIDEYMASVAALTTTGMPAAQAHTQIKTAIVGLTRKTKETSKVFKQLHVKNFKELVDKSGGMVGAFTRIRKALNGNDAAMQALFGSAEAVNAVLGLTGSQAKVFKDTLDDMRHGANAVDEAFRKQAEEDQRQWEALGNQIRHVVIVIGQQLIPVLREITGQISPIIQDILAWTKANPELTKGIVTAVAGLLAFSVAMRLLFFAAWGIRLPLIGLVGTFLKFNEAGKNVATGWRLLAGAGRILGFAAGTLLPGAFALLGSALAAIGAALASVTAPVWALVAALAAAVFAVWKYWERISAFMKGFIAPFGELASQAAELVGQAVDAILDKLGSFTGLDLSGAKTAIASFFDFSGIVQGAREALNGFWTWLSGFFSAEKLSGEQSAQFEAAGRAWGDAIVNGIKTAAQALWDWFASWPELIKNAIGSIDLSGIFSKPEWLDRLTGFLGGNTGKTSKTGTTMGPTLTGLAKSQEPVADKGWFSNLFGGASDDLADGAKRGGAAVAKGGQDAASALSKAAGEIRAAASGLRSAAANAARPKPAYAGVPASGSSLYDGGND